MIRSLISTVMALALGSCLVKNAGGAPANIVFLLADDLGWSDTTPYGSTFYETPQIARLAKRGMLFTNAYSASPLCSPTRASILTGQYPGRVRLTTPNCHGPQVVLDPEVGEKAGPAEHVVFPGTRTRLPNEYVTVAEVLKEAGYATAFVGKWHLGRAPYLPDNQGFDVVIGGREHPGPPGGYFAPWPIDTIPASPAGAHVDDVITTEAIAFMERAAGTGEPFFLNLWFYSVHAPFQAKEELIEKYRAKAAAHPGGTQANPVMGAMVETLDDNVGRVLDALDRLGLRENTLVVFTSDNGGNMYNFAEGIEATNNAPLRNGKGNIYEGGQRVPLIVSQPGVIGEGTRSEALVSSVDFYPTIVEAAGGNAPAGQVQDGVSLWPVLRGGMGEADRVLFCHFPHAPPATGALAATSVRRGDWNLIRFYGDGPGQSDRLELYNLADDIGQAHNLAGAHPERAGELNALIDGNLADTQSLVPRVNPAYQPSVHGWTSPGGTGNLSRGDGVLRMESTGGDPWMATSAFPAPKGEITVELRMKSDAAGEGTVFLSTQKQPKYAEEQRKTFAVEHDDAWHTYRIDFAIDSPLRHLRIDPAKAPGTIEFKSIRLIGWSGPGAGKVARHWDF